jgi:hypothetical protein
MEKQIREDELFKGVAHGLMLGALVIPLAYNIWIRKRVNILVYTAIAGFEIYNILGHVRDAKD